MKETKYENLNFFNQVNETDLSINNYHNPALLRDIPYDKIYEAARKSLLFLSINILQEELRLIIG